MKSFPIVRQLGAMDCGPSCIKMIAKFYGRNISLSFLRQKASITKVGVSLFGVCEAAEAIGFKTQGARVNLEQLIEEKPFPCILHWNDNHFVVLFKLTSKHAYIADPAKGVLKYTIKDFIKQWKGSKELGIVLFLEPTHQFEEALFEERKDKSQEWKFLVFYFKKYKKYFFQLFLGMTVSSVILVVLPFLTQAIVDKGIVLQNYKFIYIILIGQLFLFLGASLVDIIRSWLLLHIGTRINIAIVSDFFLKLMKLPVSFFETHVVGDILQRITDHKKLEQLLTVDSLNSVFALINIFLFGSVLWFYNSTIFMLFLFGSILSIGWTILFMKRRAFLDFNYFEVYSKNQSKEIELILGVEEIKISNSGTQKRWEWEEIQARLYKIKIKSLSIQQWQYNGSSIISKLTSILLTFLAAKLVMEGQISLGAMFAINMILGQLTNPITQILNFLPNVQDAKLALSRINEVHSHEEEELIKETINEIPKSRDINFKNVSFSYSANSDDLVLKNINLKIPSGKITAIVGASGSGKTTLLKLFLKFFPPTQGAIMLGDYNFNTLSNSNWRDNCGVVFQAGKIFSDTIANNIALGKEMNIEKVIWAARVANIDKYIAESLPLGFYTKIGDDGLQLSHGQKQRLLLARAVYKDPDYLFLDEATSALDSKNEKEVMENLNKFFNGRTVVIIAHRLSTVRNADQIIVLDKGEVVEFGIHQSLTSQRGIYFDLVKNQLELGN